MQEPAATGKIRDNDTRTDFVSRKSDKFLKKFMIKERR